ncbi:MarR family winged helix-turn-helix transcriptional regulator [Nocardia sienata]|uniref:MarR family winged helix-turn-helix transcriptional regulator n=1 Tax=Nocardia sienata TaxID=248552 RepID=UPI000B2B932F|nr:MarR family winged helix-turn-helix transcriptional regulator [Nocardia sienata]
MSTPDSADDTVRELLLLMPRLVGRAKRMRPPAELQSFDLAPRHLSLLALLLLDGPQTVSQLAGRLGVAPTTVSLIVSDLSRKEVLVRHEDAADRRRRIIDIGPASRPAISEWLSPGAYAWRAALAPLTPAQRRMVVDTLLAYEAAVAEATGERPGAARVEPSRLTGPEAPGDTRPSEG